MWKLTGWGDQMQSGMVLIPLHCTFQQQWSLSGCYFFLPTHTWQTEPIISPCLILTLQEHEKGHCPPGWVAAEMKPNERQRPNQQQFCGWLALQSQNCWLCSTAPAPPSLPTFSTGASLITTLIFRADLTHLGLQRCLFLSLL